MDLLSYFALKKVFMVGIKGSGMSALAEILSSCGALIVGSDVRDTFYTDALLADLKIRIFDLDDMKIIREAYDCVIYSAAYDRDIQPQLRYFTGRNMPVYSYPEILGEISQNMCSVAIAGTHGKTTIGGMCATLVENLGLEGICMVGGQVRNLRNRSAVMRGTRFFLAETCEYRRHFLHFHPHILLVSNIELDHQDYYRDYDDIFSAFYQFAQNIHTEGTLIYCAEDKGASALATKIRELRSDIDIIPYGKSASGAFRIVEERALSSRMRFRIEAWEEAYFDTRLFGHHSTLNAVAAIATTALIQEKWHNGVLDQSALATALRAYTGAKRRMETIGIVRGITIMDDYAHHPTAIKAALAALRLEHAKKRIVVDFMSHTYSRTVSLLDNFTAAFGDADVLITHNIYPSARKENTPKISGRRFARALRRDHDNVRYFPKPMDAIRFCMRVLNEGDLFITLGAGDNWKLGRELLARMKDKPH